MSNVNRNQLFSVTYKNRETIIVEVFYKIIDNMSGSKGDIFLMTGNKTVSDFTPDAKFPFELDGEVWNTLSMYVFSKKIPEEAKKNMASLPNIGFKMVCNENTHTNERWKDIKIKVMAEGLLAEFTQHKILIPSLVETGVRNILCAGEYTGEFCGTGKDGKGKNVYGRLLMGMRKIFRKKYGRILPREANYTKEDVELLSSFVSERKIEESNQVPNVEEISSDDSMVCEAEPIEQPVATDALTFLEEANRYFFEGTFGNICKFRVYYKLYRIIVILRMDNYPGDKTFMASVFGMEVIRTQPKNITREWILASALVTKFEQLDDSNLRTDLLWNLLTCDINTSGRIPIDHINHIASEYKEVFLAANENVFACKFRGIGQMRIYNEVDKIIISSPAMNSFGRQFYTIGSFSKDIIYKQPNELTYQWMVDNAIRIVNSTTSDLYNTHSLVIYLLDL